MESSRDTFATTIRDPGIHASVSGQIFGFPLEWSKRSKWKGVTTNERLNHWKLVRGELVYNWLRRMISANLVRLTNEAPCTEAEFLDFVQRAERQFEKKARVLHNLLTYFNDYWVSWVNNNDNHGDREYDDVLELHRNLLLSNLGTNIQAKVRDTAFKFILNGGSLNFDSSTLIRSLLDLGQAALPSFSSPRRPIYLVSRRLEQSARTRLREWLTCADEQLLNPSLPQASQIAALMATFDHGALLVGPADSSTGNSMQPHEGVVLCELNQTAGSITGFAARVGEATINGFTFCALQGYTTHTDDLLELDVQDVINDMRPGYSLLDNNCQSFCEMLLMQIKCTDTVTTELHSDYMKFLPPTQEKVMRRRHIEYIPRIYEQITKGKPPPLPEVCRIRILPAKTLANCAKVLMAVSIFFACVPDKPFVGLCVASGLLIKLLEWDGLCRLQVSELFQGQKFRPYGEYKEGFKDLIGKDVADFYQRFQCDTKGSIELHGWEPQLGKEPRGRLRRARIHFRASVD